MSEAGSAASVTSPRTGTSQYPWLPLAPFLLLPATLLLPQQGRPLGIGAVLLVSALTWIKRAVRGRRTPAPLLPRACADGEVGAWELCLLAFVAAVAVAYLVVGSHFTGLIYMDGAYYYGVARHIALTGRFEEPIVWHFLNPPETLVHAPFDYWGGMTSLLLVPPLVLFGASPRTANLTMSAISAATVLAFWYLVCVALPLRYRATQLLGLALFAFSPAMNLYRFQPESVVVAQLFILLALIAFARRWFAAAIVCGFCILLTRGDGGVLFALITGAVLVEASRPVRGQVRLPWQLVLITGACLATYLGWSVASFGTLTPPATSAVPFLRNYWEVYHYGVTRNVSWTDLLGRIDRAYVLDRMWLGLDSLRRVPFVPLLDAWLLLALLAAPVLFIQRRQRECGICVLALASYWLVVFASGVGFAPVRTPHVFTPLLVLSGALGLDALCGAVDRWMTRPNTPGMAPWLAEAMLGAGCALLLIRVPALQHVRYRLGASIAVQQDLPKLDAILQGQPVASNRAVDIVAYTQSPSVSIPTNGDRALAAVIARYGVRWLVIFGPLRPSAGPTVVPAPNALGTVLVTGHAQLDRFKLERVHVEGNLPAVIRVLPAIQDDATHPQ